MKLENIGRNTNPMVIKTKTWRRWAKSSRTFKLYPGGRHNPAVYLVTPWPGKTPVRMNAVSSMGRTYLYRCMAEEREIQ